MVGGGGVGGVRRQRPEGRLGRRVRCLGRSVTNFLDFNVLPIAQGYLRTNPTLNTILYHFSPDIILGG